MKRIIWTDDIKIEDWIDEDGKQMTYEEANELNAIYLEDERDNLDVPTEGEIICFADLGLWDGRRAAHKSMGHRLSNILYAQTLGSSMEVEWYSDGKNICGTEMHHDGTNYYVYRMLKGKTQDEQLDNMSKLCSKPITNQRIGIYTKSLVPIVNKIYGW